MNELFEAFTFGQLQDARTVLLLLSDNNLTVDDFLAFVKEKREELNRGNELGKIMVKRCPECSGPMSLLSGDDNDSHWICPKCRYSQYNSESVEEVQKRLLEESRNGL